MRFGKWAVRKSRSARPWWCKVRGAVSKTACFAQVRLRAAFIRMTAAIGKACDVDFQNLCTRQSGAMEEAAFECISRHLFALLRQLKPWMPMRDMRLLTPEGLPAASDAAEREVAKLHSETVTCRGLYHGSADLARV